MLIRSANFGPMVIPLGCESFERLKQIMAKTHGMRQSPEYITWAAMHRRCRYPSQQNYNRYGGAGISVAPEWSRFEQFFLDMGQKPQGLTLDRIDPTKGYCKSNCRWATVKEQNDSRRHVLKLIDGRVAAQVARENGISTEAFHRRIQRGWDPALAVVKPMRTIRKVEC